MFRIIKIQDVKQVFGVEAQEAVEMSMETKQVYLVITWPLKQKMT
jgi:hypothetical protein